MMVNKKNFSWLNCDVFTFSILLVTLLTVVIACPVPGVRLSGVRLAHFCISPHSEPEEGLPVIMLHGITDIKEAFDGIYNSIPLLTRRRVCLYDARNHGDSSWNDTLFTVPVLAEDLGIFMNDMKIEKAVLVGHSMGGLTCMKFALENPSRVEKIFVEDISPIRIQNEVIEYLKKTFRLMVSSLSAIPHDADEATAVKAVTDYFLEATKQPPAEFLFKKFPFRKQNGVWNWKANIDSFIKVFDIPDAFLGKMEGQYKGKVFFLYGKASPLKVWEDEKTIPELFPDSEFLGVDGAQHIIHGNFPEYNTQLIKFLKSKDT